MSVDRETVLKIARLARIRIEGEEADALSGELSQILEWVEQLKEVDTSGVEPMTSVVERVASLREDEVSDGNRVEAVTSNAPETAHGFYVVPKVVG